MEIHIKQVTLDKFLSEDPNNSINKHIASVAGKIRDRAKEKAPVAHEVEEDANPGELRDSIKAIPDPDHFGSYLVGSDLDYAAYVEFGTIHTHAQPFLRPAMDEIKAEGKR